MVFITLMIINVLPGTANFRPRQMICEGLKCSNFGHTASKKHKRQEDDNQQAVLTPADCYGLISK